MWEKVKVGYYYMHVHVFNSTKVEKYWISFQPLHVHVHKYIVQKYRFLKVQKPIQIVNPSIHVHVHVHRDVEIVSQLLDILAYFHHSCLLPIYFVYSLVSIYRTFTRFIGQCPAWLTVSTPLHVHQYRLLKSVAIVYIMVATSHEYNFEKYIHCWALGYSSTLGQV